MAALSFLNRCTWSAIASGLADFSVASPALNGYTPAQCANPAVVNGGTYHYFATSGTDHEEGDGVYTVATATLTRANIRNSSNGGAKVNFTAAPIVSMGGPVGSDMRLSSYTVATLPTVTMGAMAYVTDGQVGLAWGATVLGSSLTPYLVWFNGTNWTITGS